MSAPKKNSKSFDTIKWDIEHTNVIKHLEDDIVALVEWREEYPRTDKQYRESKDLLNFAFDKYNDMLEKKMLAVNAPFCAFLNEV